MGTHRYLTKSRFKLASECATKLHYTGDPTYFNARSDDSFLEALAEGGFQVGALACLMVPGGTLVNDREVDAQLARTLQLLALDKVVIYEATFAHQGKLVRVDILRKHGQRIDLIEVKAKSYSARKDADFRAARGGIRSGWAPYLLDVAFQQHVVSSALPGFEVHPWLMLADKEAVATVNGLGQAFTVRRTGTQVEVDVAPGTAERLGAPLLCQVSVAAQVAEIQAGYLQVGAESLPFSVAVERFCQAGRGELRIPGQPGSACINCEFKSPQWPAADGVRSGFHECWSAALGWTQQDFEAPLVLHLWNSRRKATWISEGRFKLSQLTAEDLGLEDEDVVEGEGLTTAQRQWMQCTDHPLWLDTLGLSREMADWRYPLNFIDFETAMAPIPYQAGRRPYEVIAFQFSHHVMEQDGRVRHQTQFLEATPGTDPTRPFLRALKAALETNDGTVFRWSHHENNVLNSLRQRLEDEDKPGDRALVQFIETITHQAERSPGPRNMVDLCGVSQRYFYAPGTKGSSSLKKVLPALMRHSATLRQIYSQPVYGTARMPSLNLRAPVAWWVPDSRGEPQDPYRLLPPVFADLPAEQLACLGEEGSLGLKDGGAAMAAYARLQQEALPASTRRAIESALLRYCELDTLAMVMALQAWSTPL